MLKLFARIIFAMLLISAVGARANEQSVLDDFSAAVSRVSDGAKIGLIDAFVNDHIMYATDQEAAGRSEEWLSPLQTWRRGKDDCEGYAILKYYLGLRASVPGLRLAYGELALPSDEGGFIVGAHVLLLKYESESDTNPMVLDVSSKLTTPKLLSDRRDFRLIYTFDQNSVWYGAGDKKLSHTPIELQAWDAVKASVLVDVVDVVAPKRQKFKTRSKSKFKQYAKRWTRSV